MIDFVELRKELGDGPMRFAPEDERTLEEQLADLTDQERECFDNIKTKWEKKEKNEPFDDDMYLRFARCSPGPRKFNEKTALKTMKQFDREYMKITASQIRTQLEEKLLFPVPGLKTRDGHDVFYMRPCRYYPKSMPTKMVIDNLAYCMNTMMEKEKACKEGIGFLAYMNDWKMENFSVDYCYQFMHVLQGRVPARVRLFLIVNPPSWFGSIWKIMKVVLSADFRKKVKVIPESKLSQYLLDGYDEFLPNETELGTADTDRIVQDFVAYRTRVEKEDTTNGSTTTSEED